MGKREDAQEYLRSLGIGDDPTTVAAYADGSMSWEEFQHRQQRRAAPGIGSDGSWTEAASGWDGTTRADSAITDEHGRLIDSHTMGAYQGPALPEYDIAGRPYGSTAPGKPGYQNLSQEDVKNHAWGDPNAWLSENVTSHPYVDPGSVPGRGGDGGVTPWSGSPWGNGPSQETDPVRQELLQLLLQQARQSAVSTPEDPAVKAQVDAFRAEQTRAMRNAISDNAEAQGPLANNAGTNRMLVERAGQRVGSFQAELMGRELTAKRAEIMNAINAAAGMLSDQERLELTERLALIDAELRRLGLSQQDSQFQAGLNQDWQRALMQNEQFMKQFGLNAEQMAAYWDAVRRGLI